MKTLPLIITFLLVTQGLFVQSGNTDNGSASVKTGDAKMKIGSGAILNVTGKLTIDPNGKLTINDGGALTVTDTLDNNAGAANFVIESGGSLINEWVFYGEATVKREITGDLRWHLLSSPVSWQPICDNVFAPSSGNFPGDINTWDFYKWSPTCVTSPNQHWRNLRTSTGTLNTDDFTYSPRFEIAKGYLVAYGEGFPTTKLFIGTPGHGNIPCDFSGVIDACTWELAGNPFPSAIDWNQVEFKENLVTGYYYVWNELKAGGPGYEYWMDDNHKSSAMINGYIPPMQGFFVEVDPNGGKWIGLPNYSRLHYNDNWLKNNESVANKLSITLTNGINNDEAFIVFENNGNVGKDRYDAGKLFGMSTGVPQVYTLVDVDQKTGLNSMPVLTGPVTIPVGIIAPSDGNYTLKVSGIESLGSLTGLVLEDLKMNVNQNLLQNPLYQFSATGNEDAGRFLLHFNGDLTNPDDGNPVKIYSTEKTINIFCATGLNHGRIILTNMPGQQVLSQNLIDQPLNQIVVNAVKGYYIVKVQSDDGVKTVKVFIN